MSTISLMWLRPAGIASSSSWVNTRCRCALWTSTMGDSLVTVTVSWTLPTAISTLTGATNVPNSSIPSRRTLLKPERVNVTTYDPGRRFSILYWPLPSVVADRVFSMSAGLDASTVTPGRTAPDASLTVPAMDAPVTACACATAGNSTSTGSTSISLLKTHMDVSSPGSPAGKVEMVATAVLEIFLQRT